MFFLSSAALISLLRSLYFFMSSLYSSSLSQENDVHIVELCFHFIFNKYYLISFQILRVYYHFYRSSFRYCYSLTLYCYSLTLNCYSLLFIDLILLFYFIDKNLLLFYSINTNPYLFELNPSESITLSHSMTIK